MKNKKKYGRKLKLNKKTIARLNQNKVLGGATAFCSDPCPCGDTVPTEACTFIEETCPATCAGTCTCFTCKTCQTCHTMCYPPCS